MKKWFKGKNWTIYLYAVVLAGMVFLLKAIEYKYLIHDLSVEIYVGMIAILFSVLGLWGGWKLTKGPTSKTASLGVPGFEAREVVAPQDTNLSAREIQVLRLIAAGHSNQEIADKLFLSLNTIKKHNSALFTKLGVIRRTQAIEKAKQLGLIQ